MSDFIACVRTAFRNLSLLVVTLAFSSVARGEDQVLDLLIVYTPTLADNYGGHDGVEALALSAVVSSNEAFRNSGIDLRLRLVGLRGVDYSESDEEMDVDLAHLQQRDGVMDDVFGWREDTGADLVYLFRSNTYGIDSIGIAYQLSTASGRPSFGFGVVSGQYAISDLVLQHEIGHNLGAAHDPDNTDGPGLYPYSYGHRFGPSGSPEYYRSVMAYAPGGEVNYFSGPDVLFDGFATGTEQADNARTLRQTAAIVAAYRASRPIKPFADAGPDKEVDDLDNDGRSQVQLDGSRSRSLNGIVSWSWSWSGGTAVGEQAEIELPVGTHEIQLTIFNQTQQSSTDSVTVTVDAFSPIVSTFSGSGRLFILRENGKLYAAGRNNNGTLGIKSSDYLLNRFNRVSLDGVVEVATTEYHTLFRLKNGAVYASGSNPNGALGIGENKSYADLVKVFDSGIVSIATAFAHSLFVHEDGRVLASGSSGLGKFGIPSLNFHYTPISIFPSDAKKAAVGRDFSAILKRDGTLWLAGEILKYAKPELHPNEYAKFHKVGGSGFVDIVAGESHLVALAADGSVWTTGASGSGQLASGDDDRNQYGFHKVLDAGATAIEAGPYATFVTVQDGSILGAGDFLPTQFAPVSEDQYSFIPLFRGRAVNLSAGADYGAVLLKDGSVWAMGSNHYGQFGRGPDAETNPSLTKISPITNVQFENLPPTPLGQVSGFAIDFDGDGFATVQLDSSQSFDDWFIASYKWAWLDGSSEQANPELLLPVGSVPLTLTVTDDNGISASQIVTVEVKPFTRVSQVLALENRILLIKEDGSLWGIGDNTYNAFGVDAQRSRLDFFEPLFDEGVVQVAGGANHTLVLFEDGSLWGGGSSSEGQLGIESSEISYLREIWPSGVVGISAGAHHSLFLLEDGTAMAMGNNYDGQTGDSSGVYQTFVPRVLYSSGVEQVLASDQISAVLLEDGRVLATGGSRWESGMKEVLASGVARLWSIGGKTLFYQTTEGSSSAITIGSNLVAVGNSRFGKNSNPLAFFGTELRHLSAYSYTVVSIDRNGRCLGTQLDRDDGSAKALPVGELDEHFASEVVSASCSSTHRVFLLEDGSVWAAETWSGFNRRYLSSVSEPSPLFRIAKGSPQRANELPSAVAKVPDTIYDLIEQGGGVVLLDGSLSRDDRAIKEWEWRWGDQVAYGRLSPIFFPIGDTQVTLRVTDYDGSSDSTTFTVSVRDDGVVAALSGGVVILENGQSYSVRNNEGGIMHGYPDTVRTWGAPQLARLSVDRLVSFESNSGRIIAVDETGAAWVGGSNHYGELGLGYLQSGLSPFKRVFEGGVVDSAIGRDSLFLVFEDGSLWSTENRLSGVDDQELDPSYKTWSRKRDSGVMQVAAIGDLVIYLERNGSVWAYGYNSLSELGPYRYGDFISPEEPHQLVPGGVKELFVGFGRVLVTKEDESLWGMGDNWANELRSQGDFVNEFVRLSSGPVRKVTIGDKLNAWLLQDGSLWGLGTWFEPQEYWFEPRSLPLGARPLLFADVVDISYVGSQIIALRKDGKLYISGYGDFNELLSQEENDGPYWKALNDRLNKKGPLSPVANAGPDLEIYISAESGGVFLDGSLSTDDWAIAKWRWKIGDDILESRIARFYLPEGEYVAELRVEDENGAASFDTMNLKIVRGSEIQAALQTYFSKDEIDGMADPSGSDSDGDGFSNKDELWLGTNPNDVKSRAKLTIANKGGDPHLFLGGSDRTWFIAIYYSFDLESWIELEGDSFYEVQRGLELTDEFSAPIFFRIGLAAE